MPKPVIRMALPWASLASLSFALNLDEQGDPWEIDAWKVDFSLLRQPPTQTELRTVP